MKKFASVLFVVFLVSMLFVQSANAIKIGGSIKGPEVVHVGRTYQYSVSCSGMKTNYVEFGFISKILSPRIISGDGILHYQPELYPGWFGWTGVPTDSFKAIFKLRPDIPGTYTVNLECWGETEFRTSTMTIIVTEKSLRK